MTSNRKHFQYLLVLRFGPSPLDLSLLTDTELDTGEAGLPVMTQTTWIIGKIRRKSFGEAPTLGMLRGLKTTYHRKHDLMDELIMLKFGYWAALNNC